MSHPPPSLHHLQDAPSPSDERSSQERRAFLCQRAAVPLAAAAAAPSERQLAHQLKGSPALAKLSQMSGLVNRYGMAQLQRNLRDFGIEDRGSEESCRARLKHHVRSQAIARLSGHQQENSVPFRYYYDVICVVDFEATCDPRACESRSPQEIIEFPAVLVDLHSGSVVARFHYFVKPIQSGISEYCTSLTGITKEDLEARALPFGQVLDLFETWLYSLLKASSYTSFALASDGSWDFGHFFAVSCQVNGIPFPAYAKRWINVRKVFSSHYRQAPCRLSHMLSFLDMRFEGRQHSGLDDACNIAALLQRMLLDGANPVINERISWHSSLRHSWQGVRPGVLRVFYAKPSDGLNLSDSDDELAEAILRDSGTTTTAAAAAATTAAGEEERGTT